MRRIPGLEVGPDPELSLVIFRLDAPGPDGERLNQELLGRINDTRRVMLSGTTMRGRFYLRICVLNFRTHRDRIEELLAIVERESRALRER